MRSYIVTLEVQVEVLADCKEAAESEAICEIEYLSDDANAAVLQVQTLDVRITL